ncbi:bifunctional cobalt-precorrin-7 (C(5))-methyltransferase/cobalt-precorrin-6B (C(15))-methyltransferase [Chitinophaga sancti]|uniref:Bifunctional cobalt-precorrin-7 (C(5))-methyltransferase/cobalt-precorrin-6B (C(15))-methyltransferase n=1 Tax=Chitinophaga sancti TaxID=1004 RepID=A0A1K1NHZ1_9BACT|nr:bifunctional cobalt-precorrin-7 (C(5))-methyltransferase/cobalt-precorrin-6B (C(15))-methyltransferase [Chitinophaga sancti]WQD63209.1 bifunctional cobalt-precorrin-7 (C(5))-methyltransferase/cobalt-precorrin-6B (C(15))-methyltransferase [Chitinophaga sancti]WQG91165.1 bifunctional cobalt-precorrin-7 (C(5))-methyltransferase/cobalt-precorrin-6B (C(15))-methyltransferase [Chitinophaga sancti]SFW34940.1 precorrin-6Y C5,15-methyltransferase (decarboxylating) [Chitinophaga sancti]
MNKYVVIGISDHAHFVLADEVLSLLSQHQYFSGGKRHHQRMHQYLPAAYEWIDITGDIPGLIQQYKELDGEVVIFASGDPLFYGFANSIRRYHPEAEMRVYPYFNSLQLLCQRCNIAYAALYNTSVHGRGWDELDTALLKREKLIGVLTDGVKTPAAIASRLLAYGYDNYTMIVGEALEGVEEKINTFSLPAASDTLFHALNCVLLIENTPRKKWMGIPDALFEGLENRPNMITKMPIRLLSLSQLDLFQRQVFWDIGFCTGSVAIEAKNNFPGLQVVAFEKRIACDALMDRNAFNLGVPGIIKVIGDIFEQDLSAYPPADAIFIGGHGNRLDELIAGIHHYLKPGGRLVMNAVKQESNTQFVEAVTALGYQLHTAINITIDEHNPITVLTAEKIQT